MCLAEGHSGPWTNVPDPTLVLLLFKHSGLGDKGRAAVLNVLSEKLSVCQTCQLLFVLVWRLISMSCLFPVLRLLFDSLM